MKKKRKNQPRIGQAATARPTPEPAGSPDEGMEAAMDGLLAELLAEVPGDSTSGLAALDEVALLTELEMAAEAEAIAAAAPEPVMIAEPDLPPEPPAAPPELFVEVMPEDLSLDLSPPEPDFTGVEEPTEMLLESLSGEVEAVESAPAEESAAVSSEDSEVSAADMLQATDEMLAEMLANADELLPEPEPADEPQTTPLGQQPPLDVVIRALDQELENAPAFSLLPEAPAVMHKQYSQLDDYVVFSLCGADYAIPVKDVAEIGRIPSIARVPNCPEFVRGLTNLRGEVVPVLSLQQLLGLQDAQQSSRGRVVFLQARERVSATALLVDEVKGIQRIQSQQLEQVTGLMDDKVTSVLRGVHGRGDRLLNILDLEQLFQLQEIVQLESR